jgi:hypothetical protein
MRRSATFAAALVAVAAVAASAAEQTVRNPNRVSAKGDPNQIICVIDRPPSGLLVENRICRTRAEWITLRRETREAVERVQFFKQTR